MSIEKGTKKDPAIYHIYGHTTEVGLVAMIDATGGWPIHAKHLVMRHDMQEKRPCYFTNSPFPNNEWNTSVLTADEYYWEKVSIEKKIDFGNDCVRKALRKAMP